MSPTHKLYFDWMGPLVSTFDQLSCYCPSYQPLLLLEIRKMTALAVPLKIETCNKNQMPLGLGQSSTLACHWPSLIATNI